MTGWIKLHRKLLDSPIFQNEKLFKVFAYCLMKASHKDHTQLVGRRVVELEKGQFVFGRKRASEELRLKESTVRDYIKLLENLGTIVVKSDNKFSVITAFDFFQDNGFGFITPYNLDDLNYYLDSFENDSDQIVTASLKIAKDRNKVTWGYAKSILNTWLNANLKSIEQVRAFEKQQLESKKQNYKPFVKQSKEKTPKWLTDSTRETKTPEVDENLEKDREAFIKRLNSKWE